MTILYGVPRFLVIFQEVPPTLTKEDVMPSLARDMTRVHQDIVHGHILREHLMTDLQHFAGDLHCQVEHTLHDIHAARIQETKKGAAARKEFVNNLRQNVRQFRHDFATELRNAYCGLYGAEAPIECTPNTASKK